MGLNRKVCSPIICLNSSGVQEVLRHSHRFLFRYAFEAWRIFQSASPPKALVEIHHPTRRQWFLSVMFHQAFLPWLLFAPIWPDIRFFSSLAAPCMDPCRLTALRIRYRPKPNTTFIVFIHNPDTGTTKKFSFFLTHFSSTFNCCCLHRFEKSI